jgi:hypothetical protein
MTPTRDERRRPAVLHVVLGAAAVLVAANFAYSVLRTPAPLAAPVAVAPVAPSPAEAAEAEPVAPVVPIDFTGGRDSQSIRD